MVAISFFPPMFLIVLATLSYRTMLLVTGNHQLSHSLSLEEATIRDIQRAFKQNELTSRELVEFYLSQIDKLNPKLRGVIEVNPDALLLADKADKARKSGAPLSRRPLHGIPVLLKDNIATKDKLNTTAGSYALLGSVVPRNAFVVMKLIKAGAIILGKASLTEWAGLRDSRPGWCARSGQGVNPYVATAGPCGSSSGSAISVAANMAALSLGTETDGSILCPSSFNSVVGIKPTVGLTSRDGIIPITPRQDSVGPICRTMTDAVYVLDTIVGFDNNDKATSDASQYIPQGGYKQFLNPNGLKGKRLGLIRDLFFDIDLEVAQAFDNHIQTLSQQGAVFVNNLKIDNIEVIYNGTYEMLAMGSEFKISLNKYLKRLVKSPVRSLTDVIAFNKKFSDLEKTKEYPQEFFLEAEKTDSMKDEVKAAVAKLEELTKKGFEKLTIEHELDAIFAPNDNARSVLAIGGFPGISVPAGYDKNGKPFGICFGGLRGSEPKLIEIAYGFEQATKIRKPPTFKLS